MSILSRIVSRIWTDLHKGSERIESEVATAVDRAKQVAEEIAAAVAKSISARTSQVQILDDEAEYRKAQTGEDLSNWRSSIVDFCKLVNIDPSFANRRDLALELGMRAYSGSGAENVELSKRLLDALR